MPKGRHLKPDFFTDKHIVCMSPLARLLYQGLWCYAADCGHIDDEPVEFKMRILPADSCDVEELLGELVAAGRIVRADDAIYLPTLTRHGRIDKRYETVCDACKARREHSGKPSPQPSNHSVTTTGPQRDHDGATRADPPPHAGDGDGDGLTKRARRARDLDTDPHFMAFWAEYPRRDDKGHARTAWMTNVVNQSADADAVIAAAKRFAQRVEGSERKFIALPATWLNGERWLDEEPGEVAETNSWDRFVLPTPPDDVADDGAKYVQWVKDQKAAWDAARAAGGDR